MDISSLFHVTAKRVFLLIVAAGLAAALTGAFLYSRPPVYRATGTVYITQVFDQGTPNYSLSPFADDFRTSLTLPAVIDAAVKATHENPGNISAKLTSSTIDTTDNIAVVYSSTNRIGASKVIGVASHATLRLLAQNQVDKAQLTRNEAERTYVAASNAQSDFESKNGTNPTSPALQTTYRALQASTTNTLNAFIDAKSPVAAAQLQLKSADSPALVAVDPAINQSSLTSVLRGAVIAGVVTAMIGALFFAFPVRPRRMPLSDEEIEEASRRAPEELRDSVVDRVGVTSVNA